MLRLQPFALRWRAFSPPMAPAQDMCSTLATAFIRKSTRITCWRWLKQCMSLALPTMGRQQRTRPDQAMRVRILSAGVIPVRRTDERWLYLLLRAYQYWDFPKGKTEA